MKQHQIQHHTTRPPTPKKKWRDTEIFTPAFLVNAMLDKLPQVVWEPGKTFCDPACGTGNLLVETLRRKLNRGHLPLQALSTIYGVDIQTDLVKTCQLRLLKVVADGGHQIVPAMVVVVFNNIVVTPLGEKYPKGALSYAFDFRQKASSGDEKVGRWMQGISNDHWLDRVES